MAEQVLTIPAEDVRPGDRVLSINGQSLDDLGPVVLEVVGRDLRLTGVLPKMDVRVWAVIVTVSRVQKSTDETT